MHGVHPSHRIACFFSIALLRAFRSFIQARRLESIRSIWRGDLPSMGRCRRISIAILATVFGIVSSAAFADCQQILADARAVASTVAVSFEDSAVRAGDEIKIVWRSSKRGHLQFPLYLVVFAPAEFRFAGNGFMALNAHAKGPQGIDFEGAAVRAFAPLFRDQDALNGQITLAPFRSGSQRIGWAIVMAGECGQHVFARADKLIDVTAGRPEIVVQDRFTTQTPVKRIKSPTGKHEIAVFKDRYEVYDLLSGAKVLDRAGTDPNFSPTGRFVAARGDSGIVDLISGRKIADGNIGDNFLAWLRGDSYAIVGAIGTETLIITNTLADGRGAFEVALPCGLCRALGDLRIIFDADHGYSAVKSNQWSILDLYSGEMFPKDAVTDDEMESEDTAGKLIREAYDPTLSRFPEHWDLREPLVLSHVTISPNKDEPALQAKALVHHLNVDVTERSEAQNSAGELRGRRQTSRGFEVGGRPQVPDTFDGLPKESIATIVFARLAENGVDTLRLSALEPAVETPLAIGQRTQALKIRTANIVKQIQRSLPVTKDVFWRTAYESRCAYDNHPISIAVPDILKIWYWRSSEGEGWLLYTSCLDGTTHQMNGQLVLIRPQASAPVIDLQREFDVAPGQEQGSKWALGDGVRVFRVSDETLAIEFGGSAYLIAINNGAKQGKENRLVDSNILAGLQLTADKQHLVQVNSDGRFFIHSVADGVQILKGVCIGGEIVVMTENGLYDSTFDGAQDVQVRFPGLAGLHYFNQFEAILRRPGLASAVLGKRPVQPPSTSVGAPPSVSMTVGPADANARRVVKISADTEQELSAVQLYVDGQFLDTRSASGKHADIQFSIPDPGAGRWVEALAVDQKGIVSLPSGAVLTGTVRPRGTMRAVVIGVDSYTDSRLPSLKFARSDAVRFAEALPPSQGKSVQSIAITKLVDPKLITPQSVQSAVRKAVEATGPNDTLVVFYSGHGVDGRAVNQPEIGLALTTPTTKVDRLGSSAIPWNALAEILAKARGKTIVVLDACHAGAAQATNDDLVRVLANKSGPMVVLAASKGRQLGYDGVFTSALVSAMSDARMKRGRGEAGLIDLGNLYLAVKARVQREKKGMQTPWLVRNALVGNMALF
jgi:Caspase domain